MDTPLQQVAERGVDRTLACHAGEASEGGAFDHQGKMAFAAAVVAGVAEVLVALVIELEPGWSQGRDEALLDLGGDRAGGGGSLGHGGYIEKMSVKASKWHGRIEGAAAHCAVPGCRTAGEFRAPLRPGDFDGPGDYLYLCLDHVRAHNARYNYFTGMSADEIEAAQSPIAGWERATRAFATADAGPGPAWSEFIDPLDAISARFRPGMARPRPDRFTAGERGALGVMGLNDEADRNALRRRYSELVRRYHPDRNGGDRGFEDRLGQVLDAYQLLKGSRAFAA